MLHYCGERPGAVEINNTFYRMRRILDDLGDRPGVVLVQLPPNLKREFDRLEDFMDLRRWAERIQARAWRRAFVLFKHEDTGGRFPDGGRIPRDRFGLKGFRGGATLSGAIAPYRRCCRSGRSHRTVDVRSEGLPGAP